MSVGWKKRQVFFKSEKISEDEIWQKVNFFYSDGRKRNTYKFGMMKSILDSLFTMTMLNDGYYISYDMLFDKFTRQNH